MLIEKLEEQEKMFAQGLRQFEIEVEKKKSQKETLLAEQKKLEKDIEDLDIGNYEKAAIWMKELAQNQREAASEELSELGTMALQYAMGPDYQMKIEMGGTIKSPKADVWFIKDNKEDEKEDPMEDNGGGIVDIIGSSMQITCLNNYNEPSIDGPVIFDEPFKMVSDEYIPMLSQFTANVAKDFGRQVITVTHNDYLSAMTDSTIYVCLDENKHSVVTVQHNNKEGM
jgi:DNA repair exonuclease SbcCD ATPase subunit